MREWYDYRTDAIIRRDPAADKGGTMRLGSYPCVLTADTLAGDAYGEAKIMERHRHRYEFNNHYREQLKNAGLVISGTSPNGELVEIIELRPSLVLRVPISSRIQVPTPETPPPVPGLHPGLPGI